MTSNVAQARARSARRRTLRAAFVGAAALVAITALAFVGANPFSHPYEIRGVFTSANGLRVGNDVRIAGVTVGAVTNVSPGPRDSSIVTLQIDDRGRPVHAGAELAIVPRLALEGSFFVALRPGDPSAPELRSGATVPLDRTSIPVQLDQVIDTFDLATRGALPRAIGELGASLSPSPPHERVAVPAGYRSLRRAVRAFDAALPPVTAATRALRGSRPGDLGRTVRATADVASELAADPASLGDLVTNVDRVTASLAAEQRPLRATVRALDRLVRTGATPLRRLGAAAPSVTAFAAALRPALREAPVPLRSTTKLVAQLRGLFAAEELPGLLRDSRPLLEALTPLERHLATFAPLVTTASRCLQSHVVWLLNQKVPDGHLSTGDPVYLDAAHSMTGAAGTVAGLDGNGVSLRAGIVQNTRLIDGYLPGFGRVVGSSPAIEGLRPTWLGYGVEPPWRPDQPCTRQPLPDLTKRQGPAPELPINGRRARVGAVLP